MLANDTQLAKALGYADARLVRNYRARGAPKGRDLVAWQAWIKKNIKKHGKPSVADPDLRQRLTVATVRNKEAEADSRELKIAKARGEVLPTDQLARGIAIQFSYVADWADRLVDEIAKEIPPELRAQIITSIKRKVQVLQRKLADPEEFLRAAVEAS